ncbi:MAG: hypothetical protein ACO3MW_04190, partial [Rhodospirillales bacterium]
TPNDKNVALKIKPSVKNGGLKKELREKKNAPNGKTIRIDSAFNGIATAVPFLIQPKLNYGFPLRIPL